MADPIGFVAVGQCSNCQGPVVARVFDKPSLDMPVPQCAKCGATAFFHGAFMSVKTPPGQIGGYQPTKSPYEPIGALGLKR